MKRTKIRCRIEFSVQRVRSASELNVSLYQKCVIIQRIIQTLKPKLFIFKINNRLVTNRQAATACKQWCSGEKCVGGTLNN